MFSLVETTVTVSMHISYVGSQLIEKISGRIVTPGSAPQRAGLTIRDGRIERLARGRRRRLDFGDALLLPGAVDVHVHTRSYDGEGIERCTLAAAAGGVTTIVDMPYDAGGPIDSARRVRGQGRRRRARGARRRRAVGDGPPARADRPTCRRSSTPARRRSSSRPSRPTRSASRGSPTVSCCARSRRSRPPAGWPASTPRTTRSCAPGSPPSRRPTGGADPLAHARSRPPVAEHEAIARVLEFARATGVRLHICHVSTPRGVELVAAARRDGVDVSAETCPHYLLLDETELPAPRRRGEDQPAAARGAAAGRRA